MDSLCFVKDLHFSTSFTRRTYSVNYTAGWEIANGLNKWKVFLRTPVSLESPNVWHTIDRFFVIVMVHHTTCQLCPKGSFDISSELISEPLAQTECCPWSSWKSRDIWLNTHFLPKQSTGYETRGLYLEHAYIHEYCHVRSRIYSRLELVNKWNCKVMTWKCIFSYKKLEMGCDNL